MSNKVVGKGPPSKETSKAPRGEKTTKKQASKKIPTTIKEAFQLMPLPGMKKVKVVKKDDSDSLCEANVKDIKLSVRVATLPRKSDETVSTATATVADGVGTENTMASKSGGNWGYDGIPLDKRQSRNPDKLKRIMKRISIAIGAIVVVILILVVLLIALMVGASSSRKGTTTTPGHGHHHGQDHHGHDHNEGVAVTTTSHQTSAIEPVADPNQRLKRSIELKKPRPNSRNSKGYSNRTSQNSSGNNASLFQQTLS